MRERQSVRSNLTGSTTASGSKRCVRVVLLSREEFDTFIEGKAKAQDVFNQVCEYLGLRETEYFGLAQEHDSEYHFVDLNTKLHRLTPRGWKSKQGEDDPIITFYFRVQFYVDHISLLKERLTRHLYYQQLRDNLLNYNQFLTEEQCFLLASYALQADHGNYIHERHRERYFDPREYLPAWVVARHGDDYIIENMPRMHRDLNQLSKHDAEKNFIKDVCIPPVAHNLHFYKLKKRKTDELGTAWLGISASGIEIYEERDHFKSLMSTFLWKNIGKLEFVKKKFEIRAEGTPECRKFTYYTGSHDRSKYLLALSRGTHLFQIANQSKLAEIRHLEAEDRRYKESYIYSEDRELSWESENSSVSRRSGRSPSAGPPTTDDRGGQEIMIDTPPQPGSTFGSMLNLVNSPSTWNSPQSLTGISPIRGGLYAENRQSHILRASPLTVQLAASSIVSSQTPSPNSRPPQTPSPLAYPPQPPSPAYPISRTSSGHSSHSQRSQKLTLPAPEITGVELPPGEGVQSSLPADVSLQRLQLTSSMTVTSTPVSVASGVAAPLPPPAEYATSSPMEYPHPIGAEYAEPVTVEPVPDLPASVEQPQAAETAGLDAHAGTPLTDDVMMRIFQQSPVMRQAWAKHMADQRRIAEKKVQQQQKEEQLQLELQLLESEKQKMLAQSQAQPPPPPPYRAQQAQGPYVHVPQNLPTEEERMLAAQMEYLRQQKEQKRQAEQARQLQQQAIEEQRREKQVETQRLQQIQEQQIQQQMQEQQRQHQLQEQQRQQQLQEQQRQQQLQEQKLHQQLQEQHHLQQHLHEQQRQQQLKEQQLQQHLHEQQVQKQFKEQRLQQFQEQQLQIQEQQRQQQIQEQQLQEQFRQQQLQEQQLQQIQEKHFLQEQQRQQQLQEQQRQQLLQEQQLQQQIQEQQLQKLQEQQLQQQLHKQLQMQQQLPQYPQNAPEYPVGASYGREATSLPDPPLYSTDTMRVNDFEAGGLFMSQSSVSQKAAPLYSANPAYQMPQTTLAYSTPAPLNIPGPNQTQAMSNHAGTNGVGGIAEVSISHAQYSVKVNSASVQPSELVVLSSQNISGPKTNGLPLSVMPATPSNPKRNEAKPLRTPVGQGNVTVVRAESAKEPGQKRSYRFAANMNTCPIHRTAPNIEEEMKSKNLSLPMLAALCNDTTLKESQCTCDFEDERRKSYAQPASTLLYDPGNIVRPQSWHHENFNLDKEIQQQQLQMSLRQENGVENASSDWEDSRPRSATWGFPTDNNELSWAPNRGLGMIPSRLTSGGHSPNNSDTVSQKAGYVH